MLQEQTIKKITDAIPPLVKLELFTQQEVEELQRVNENPAPAISAGIKPPERDSRTVYAAGNRYMLKVTVKAVYDFIKEGKLELIKLGGRTSRISGDDILRLIQSSRISHKKSEKTQIQG